jgi:uncharacterized repeat protein (TIGR01451 family)
MPCFTKTFRSFSGQSVRVLFVTLLVVIGSAFAYQAKTAITDSAIAAVPVTTVNNPHSTKSVFTNLLNSSRSWVWHNDLFNINAPVVSDTTTAQGNTPDKRNLSNFLWQTSSLTKMFADTDKPTVTVIQEINGPAQVILQVQDTGSGLASIVVTKRENVEVYIPIPPTAGQTSPVTIWATKTGPTLPWFFELKVTDVAGNVTIFSYGTPALTDLSVTKTDSPDPVAAGGQITYTVVVTNKELNNAAFNVKLTDSIPAGTTFKRFEPETNWTCGITDAGTILCEEDFMAAFWSFKLVYTVDVSSSVAPGTILINTANVTADTADPVSENNSATATTTVSSLQADLSVTKTDSPDPVIAGNNITYTINVTNNGPDNAQNVALADTLPDGTTFQSISASDFTCTKPSVGATGTVACSRATLAVGETKTVTVAAKVNSGTASGTVISNTATVASVTADPISGNNSATATTTVTTQADLSVTKTDSPDPVIAGNQVTYTVTVTNNGPSSAQNVSLTDSIPAGTTLTGFGSGTNLETCSASSAEQINCRSFSSLASGASLTLVYTLNVSNTVAGGTILSNTATVSSSTTDPNTANNSVTATTTVIAPDLTIAKSHTGDFIGGQSGSYTITVSNSGNASASGTVSVVDTLPAGLTATSISGTGWSCTLATLTCTRSDALASGSSYPVITLNVNVAANASSSVTNTATVSGGGDNNTDNNTANDQTNIVSKADLSITKTDSPDPVTDGNDITYTIAVTNHGPSNAQNVVITDSILAGTTFNSITHNNGPAFSCSSSSGTVTCTNATMAAGTSATFTLVVQVNSGTASGTIISNTATVNSSTTDPVSTNNSSTALTTVINRPTIAKAFSPSVIQPTQNSTVSLTLSNPNSIALTNASFTDNLSNMSTVGGASGGSCSGASSNVFASGATALSFSNITIPASGSCTVTFAVTSSTIGTHPNQTSGVTTNQTTGAGAPSNTAQLIVDTNPVVIGKGFTPTRIQPGGTSTVTVYLSNASNLVAATNASFTDTLVNMAAVGGAVGGTCQGTTPNVLQAGATNLSFSGITIPAQSQCTITYRVTSNITGTHPNVLSGVSIDQNSTPGAVSNIANLTVTAPPSITKSFSPSTVSVGGVSTLVVTITNPSINVAALQDVGVADVFPIGMQIADLPNITNTCSNGSVSSINEGGGIFIAATTIAVNSSCTFTINVKASSEGSLVNTTGPVTSSNGGNGNTASAVLSVGQRTNVALASNGGIASASSVFNADGSPDRANDGVRVWATTGAWKDATANSYPDWLQVNFNGSKTINEIDVYAVKDDFSNASEPTETTTFSQYGITDYEVQYWNGSNWTTVPGGNVTGNNKVWRKFVFAPITTTAIRVLVNNAQSNYSRIVELEAYAGNGTVTPTPTPVVTPTVTLTPVATPTPTVTPTPNVTPTPGVRTNVALSSNGAVVQASSYLSNGAPSIANDGIRNWATSGAWKDSTPDAYPDILEINFASIKTINEIDVYAVKDDFSNPTDPTINETFTAYGITNFEVQYWNGSSWTTVPNGYIASTNKVITRLLFSPITTNAIRVVVYNAQANYSRIVELEAWSESSNAMPTPTATPNISPTPTPNVTPTPNAMNVALASKGSTASASSTISGSSPSIAIDGIRNWATSGAWKDATPDIYPDFLDLNFNTNRTISEIAVFAVKDDFSNPTDPTVNETFTTYGITSFEVQYWNGTGWTTVPGGNITNNNKVITKLTFAPITTTAIRVVVNAAQSNYSRIVELEAWGN